ncbi:MAG: NifB/NifX family molybdenum-iron cluster-binding protein [bacterium]
MILAIAVEETNIETIKVAEHFGRCVGFKIYEINDQKEIIKESFSGNPLDGTSGGTCQLPHFVNQLHANVIIAGGMGPKAIQLFESYNIEVITAPGLLVSNVLSLFLQGDISGYQECSNHAHECSE